MEYTVSSKQLANMGIPDLPLEAFGGMRPLPRAMVNAGITYHKGGAAKWIAPVVAVAAAIVIPYAAPAVFSALASSVGVAAATMSTTAFTIGSAVVGAGMGALAGVASAAISGQNMGRSALFGAVGGAIGGGVGGYAEAGKMAATAAQTAAPGATATTAAVEAAPSVVPAEAIQITEDGIAYSKITGEMLTETPQGFVAASQSGQASNIGAQLSNAPAEYAPLGGDTAATQAAPQAGLQTVNAPAAAPTELAQVTASPAGDVVNGVQTTANAGAAAGNVASKAPMTFGEALKQVPSTIAAKFSDPKALADMTLRAAGQLAGSQLAGSGLSPEEQQLLNAQRSELEQLRETNRDLFNQRLQAAQNLIGESKYFDPEYFGLQSQRRVQTAAGLQTQEALRKISPQRAGLRAAEERRARLGATMAGETAYLQGADTAEQNRLRVEQAGINAMPTTAPAGSLQYGQYLGGLYDVGYNRRNKEAAGIGSFIGGLTGTNKAGSLFG